MSLNHELAKRMEKRAKELAKVAGAPGLWELFLGVAYTEDLDEKRAAMVRP